MYFGFAEKYIAVEGQKIFHTTKDYSVGTGTLSVFVNGILVFSNDSYVETNKNTITFNYGLSEGDIVALCSNNGFSQTFVANENQVEFKTLQAYNLSNTNSVGTLLVFNNGILMYKKQDYEETDRYTIKFYDGVINTGDIIVLTTATGFSETIQSKNNQTKFRISRKHNNVDSLIIVSVNGIIAHEGLNNQYLETGSNEITFNYPLNADDVVGISTFYINKNEVIPYTINPIIINKYADTEYLKNNNKYNIKVNIKNKTFAWSFTSKYSPQYTTLKNIRTELLNSIDVVTDEQINYMIYLNSKEGLELYKENPNYDVNNIPNYLKQWVKFKTCIDLIYTIYFASSAEFGRLAKIIGPMQLEKDRKVPYIKDMLSKYSKQFASVDYILKGSMGVSASFTKGITNYPYPLNARNSF